MSHIAKKKCFHYTEGYNESTEPIDAVNILPLARFEPVIMTTPPSTNILPLARFEPMTMTTQPSTTPDNDATNCATETYPKQDVQEALILTTTDAVHVVYATGLMQDCESATSV